MLFGSSNRFTADQSTEAATGNIVRREGLARLQHLNQTERYVRLVRALGQRCKSSIEKRLRAALLQRGRPQCGKHGHVLGESFVVRQSGIVSTAVLVGQRLIIEPDEWLRSVHTTDAAEFGKLRMLAHTRWRPELRRRWRTEQASIEL